MSSYGTPRLLRRRGKNVGHVCEHATMDSVGVVVKVVRMSDVPGQCDSVQLGRPYAVGYSRGSSETVPEPISGVGWTTTA